MNTKKSLRKKTIKSRNSKMRRKNSETTFRKQNQSLKNSKARMKNFERSLMFPEKRKELPLAEAMKKI